MSYTYEQGKATEAALIAEVDKWDAVLKAFPRGAIGLTPDEVKKSPEYFTAKLNFDLAFSKQRVFSAGFTRRYKKEMLAERKAKRTEGTKIVRDACREYKVAGDEMCVELTITKSCGAYIDCDVTTLGI